MVVFDMDGVLVDPSETFRRALIKTVWHFARVRMTQDDIVRIKNGGGFNDDSDIAIQAIREAGCEATPAEVRAFGRELYWGSNADGLVRNERWLVRPGVLERLASLYRLGIFTGRGLRSTRHTLQRFCPAIHFHPIITHEQVNQRKPAPDGLLKILHALPGANIVFVGDNIDDGRAANAAGVPFVAVASPQMPRHQETRDLFAKLGAVDVLDSVNDLESCLG